MIKFRCWFANKMWYSIPAIRFQESGIMQVDLNHDVGDFSGTPDTWTGEDDYDLMQFTGLHDKNGKEIYEGDILFNGAKKGKVVWDFVDVDNFIRGWSWISKDGPEGWNTPITVIGNIYENPELLGGGA